MSGQSEIERKFDIPAGQPLPDLSPAGAVAEPVESHLSATYVDTASLALARHKVTLRRRTGGHDAGWHLKLPVSADERLEVHHPLGADDEGVPALLLDQVRAIVRDHPLRPVAVLRTVRVEHTVRDAGGTDLVVVADDSVDAERLTGAEVETSSWREVEAEIVDGDRAALEAVSGLLLDGGLTVAGSASKLARVLGPPEPPPSASLPADSAAARLVADLRGPRDDLVAADRAARTGGDALALRSATRALSARLAAEQSFADPAAADGLVAGLARLDARLGAPSADVAAVLSDPQYYRLLDDLDALLDDPPLR